MFYSSETNLKKARNQLFFCIVFIGCTSVQSNINYNNLYIYQTIIQRKINMIIISILDIRSIYIIHIIPRLSLAYEDLEQIFS